MAIVMISQGSLGAGQTVAEGVATKLGYRSVGSEELVAAAAAHGLPPQEGTRVIETAPSFWERLTISSDSYLANLQLSMTELASGGNLVYHGFGGQELLKGVGNIAKVRVIAPMSQRIATVMKARGLAERAAAQWIQQVDEDRLRRMRHLFKIDWRDPALYDMTINLASMEVDTAVELIAALSARPEFQSTPKAQKQLSDLLLASRVKATICEMAGVSTVDVAADDGHVRLTGTIRGFEDEIAELVRIVTDVDGVTKIDTDIRARNLTEFPLQ